VDATSAEIQAVFDDDVEVDRHAGAAGAADLDPAKWCDPAAISGRPIPDHARKHSREVSPTMRATASLEIVMRPRGEEERVPGLHETALTPPRGVKSCATRSWA